MSINLDALLRPLSELAQGAAAWSVIAVRRIEEVLATSEALSFGPLITIDAVGVAIAIFALEQKITAEFDLAEATGSRVFLLRRRAELWRHIFEMLVIGGVFHLVSILLVLIDRSHCEDECPVASVSALQVWATHFTFVGVVLILIAGVVLALRLANGTALPQHRTSLRS